ncbi:uncharacterized protein LOC143368070 [Andrena cerasifolii]|uniref:uncharacterized protein LOC143368070 n=1 Tax=Andrena cerasifolii TaxID=2819439 RepID=UPI004037F828
MDTKIPAQLEFSGNIADNYKKYKQRFEIYLTANDFQQKSDEIKVAMLLNTIGEEGIEIFNNFDFSDDDRKTYDLIIQRFDTYLLPKKNVVYERYVFYKRNQEVNEPIENFVKDLKKLSQSCEFRDEQDMIRDRIVLGINNTKVQEKLLSVKDLELEKAVQMCKAAELLKERMKELKVVKNIEKKFDKKHSKEKKDQNGAERKVKSKEESKFSCRRCYKTHGPRE